MEETLESTIHNVSVVESPEFEIVNPRMKEIVKKAMNNRAKKAAMNSLNRSGRSNSSFVLRQASAIQLKNKAIIKELAKARAFNTQLENAVKRFRDQHLVLAMRLASAERKLKQMIEKDAAKQNFILLCKENLTSMVKAFENVEVDVECSPLESFHTASLERRPQRVLQSVTYPHVLDSSRIIKRNCEQKTSKSNVSDITENSDETDSTDDEEDKMSHCDDDGLEDGIAEKNQAEQNTSICHNDSKETISDEIARPDEESPVELDLNVSFSSESSFSSLRHADFRKRNGVETQDNDEEEVDSIANRTVMEVNEAEDSAVEERDVALEKPQKQVENPIRSEITERKENNNSSEGATKPDTLSKWKKKNRSSVKRKKSSKVVQQAKSNNSAYDLHSVSDDSFILDPNKAIKLTTKNGSHVENDSQSKINGRKLTHVETMEEMEIVPQEEHSELNENSARTKKSRLSVKNLTNIRSTTSDSFLLEPSRGGKVASTTKSQARSRSHGQNELNDENEEPVGRFRQRRKAPVSYLEPSLRKKLRREDPPAKHFQVLESLQN